jgi:response regulator NasT
LRDAGHEKVILVHQREGLVRQIADINPDVMVIDLENPNRDRLEHMFQVSRAVQRPIAMFVDTADSQAIEAAVDAGVSAYIVDGLKRERVKPILDMAISRFRAFSKLTQDLEDARNELADRKTIDRAKGILMKSKNLTEQEAYDLLRKTAMNQSRKIIEVAQSLVIASGLLGD